MYELTKQKYNIHAIKIYKAKFKFPMDYLNQEDSESFSYFIKKVKICTYIANVADALKFIRKKYIYRQIKEMLEQNIICHSASPYLSLICVMPKKPDTSNVSLGTIPICFASKTLSEHKLNYSTI